jgi:large subunit ribosomal protein L6
MSRLARKPLDIPAGVEVNKLENNLKIKGSKGVFDYEIHPAVNFIIESGKIMVTPTKHHLAKSMLGTSVVTLRNMLIGASKGFERKLKLNGVGYRAKVQGNTLELTLGFSHPVTFTAPEGVTIQVPSNTEIVITGSNKQVVGQTAAKIRGFREPECYKGKGVRYDDEHVVIKETKKK